MAAVRGDGAIEPVHSCGHGPRSGGVLAAALALAGLGDRLPGTVVVMGCPADEIHAPGTVARGVFADDEAGLRAAARPLRDALGRDFVEDPGPLPFATDFGNVSQRVPAALVGVGRSGGWGFHTDEGATQFAGPDGQEAMAGMARVLALTAARLLTGPHPPGTTAV